MNEDRIKWNERYSGEEFFFSRTPSPFLARSMAVVSAMVKGRRALDLACGEGRNALYLARNGFEVTAVDIAERGLERGRGRAVEMGLDVTFVHADLEQWLPEGNFDLILNFNFLLRPLVPWMGEALSAGGVVVMETILDAPGLEGGHRKDYLLQPGELGKLFGALNGKVLLLEEDTAIETPVARVLFRKAG